MKLLRAKIVAEKTGLSRMTIYRLEASGRFPRRIKLGQHLVAWREEDIEEWIRARPEAAPYKSAGLLLNERARL